VRAKEKMHPKNFKVGDLLRRIRTGKSVLVVEVRYTGRAVYGKSKGRRVQYCLLEEGKRVWKHDIQAHSEYKRIQ